MIDNNKKSTLDEKIYVLTADMENRTPEEIARDFTNQISDMFDKLIEEDRNKKQSKVYNNEKIR